MIAFLTVIISFVGAAVIGFVPAKNNKLIRNLALLTSVATFAAAVACYFQYLNAGSEVFQQVIDLAWIPAIGAQFKIGVDGLSISLLVLTGCVSKKKYGELETSMSGEVARLTAEPSESGGGPA